MSPLMNISLWPSQNLLIAETQSLMISDNSICILVSNNKIEDHEFSTSLFQMQIRFGTTFESIKWGPISYVRVEK